MRNHIQLADAYYRLSDEERKYGESASITNQRTIVREFCQKHGIILVEEFVDDGSSGWQSHRLLSAESPAPQAPFQSRPCSECRWGL